MSRPPRPFIPGVPQHVVQRGNNHQPCFLGVGDQKRYLADLKEACRTADVALHAYALMGNHVHLLATPSRPESLGLTMQILGRRYVAFVNAKYGRSGSLWEGRFKACLVDSESYLWTCHRYIELNPVRAGICGHPSEYRWSSFRHNALGASDPLVSPRPEYHALGACPEVRAAAYAQLFGDTLADHELRLVRESLHQQKALGTRAFQRHASAELGRILVLRGPGRPRKTAQPKSAGNAL